MLEPLTRAILEAFGDRGERTYDQVRTHVMATVRDATDLQLYFEVMRLRGLGAIENLDRNVIPGDTGRMRFSITRDGIRCRSMRVDPGRLQGIEPGYIPSEFDPVDAEADVKVATPTEKRKPTPSDWEW